MLSVAIIVACVVAAEHSSVDVRTIVQNWTHPFSVVSLLWMCVITPHAHARARGYVIGRGVYISARTFFYLSKYSLSDAHFSTGRLLFEFNHLQYTLAAPEVFVSSANPVILPSGYRVSIVRNTNIY